MDVDLKSKYRVIDGVAYRTVAGRVAVVDPRENRVLTLNSTASMIWQNLEEKTLAEIMEIVKCSYDVNEQELERDVLDFVSSMCRRRLLERICGDD